MTKRELFGAFIVVGSATMVGFAINGAFPVKVTYSKSRAVVHLLSENNRSSGTGFTVVYGDKIRTITNAHVCANSKYMVARNTMEGTPYNIKVIKVSYPVDLCILEATPKLKPLGLSRGEAKVGETIYAIGHPDGGPQVTTQGIRLLDTKIRMPFINGTKEYCESVGMEYNKFDGGVCVYENDEVSTSVRIRPGSSGSPVLNSKGFIVGVMNLGSYNTGWGTYIKLRDLKKLLESELLEVEIKAVPEKSGKIIKGLNKFLPLYR